MLSAIVQGISEALPVSSSMHLGFLGVTNTHLLHTTTGLTGLAYLLLNKIFVLEIKHALNLIRAFMSSINSKNERAASGRAEMKSKAIVLLTILLFFMIYRSNRVNLLQLYALAKNNLIVLSILNAILIMSCELFSSTKINDHSLASKIVLTSIICNGLGILPGFSRLGTVYAGLRVIGLPPSEAFRYSMLQGIFISSFAILLDLPFNHLIQFDSLFPLILCSSIYYFMISILLKLGSGKLSQLILWCCFYRLILPMIVTL